MKIENITRALISLAHWDEGAGSLLHVADVADLDYEELLDCFFVNDLCDTAGNPLQTLHTRAAIQCFILYVALGGQRKSGKS